MDKIKLFNTVLEVLNSPSPTFKEGLLSRTIRTRYFPSRSSSPYQVFREGDSFIASPKKKNGLPHLALVGHLDVVPEFVPAKRSGGKIHGAGASDMKASLGVFLYLLENHPEIFNSGYQVSFVFYAKEEGTPLEKNGLYELIKKFPEWFQSVNLALVGEPTDNSVQIGCCGSIHARVRIQGKACHSARPWQGENALYKALPFLNRMRWVKPRPYRIGGVVFRDVWEVTAGQTEGGTTTVPGAWTGNVNYRFAPRMEKEEAIAHFTDFLLGQGLTAEQFEIYSFSPMGKIVETPLYRDVINFLKKRGMGIEPKQAWTDVAQFGMMGIPAFNCGPGLTAKCHTSDEYALEEDIIRYTEVLRELLISKSG